MKTITLRPIAANLHIRCKKEKGYVSVLSRSSPKVQTLENQGCKCEEVSLPSVQYALASYYTIATAEASSNLARYDNIRYGFDMNPEGYEWNSYFARARSNFGEEAKRRIIIGSYVLSSGYYGKYYLKAHQVRSLLKREMETLFKSYDVLIGP